MDDVDRRRHTRRTLLAAAGTAVAPLAGCTGGGTTPTRTDTGPGLSSPAFDDGGTIPTGYTCDGADVSPPLSIGQPGADVAALALVVDDPDAPREEPFVHWLLWNVPPATREVPADVPDDERVEALGGAVQGTNSFGAVGYAGPCPPEGGGSHTYRFTLSALDAELAVEPGAVRDTLQPAIDDHRLGATTLVVAYERP